jgi:uncharacterized damage-inducible protein DinB
MSSPPFVPICSAAAAAIAANQVLLAQGVEMIRRLGATNYDRRVELCFGSTAGGHFRHAIEHYQALIAALENDDDLNYENRERDVLIETDAAHATDILQTLSTALASLAQQPGGRADRALRQHAECEDGALLGTTLGRELEFLINHTVHHWALIAVIAKSLQVTPPADFGMAPSTLKYRQTQSTACAR